MKITNFESYRTLIRNCSLIIKSDENGLRNDMFHSHLEVTFDFIIIFNTAIL